MSLFLDLQNCKTEEDVKDCYIKALHLKGYQKNLIDIQTKEVWFEAKVGSKVSTYAMFTQLLFYVKQALEQGEEVPPFLCVIDSKKAALMKSEAVMPLLQDKKIKIKWGRSASEVSLDALQQVSQFIGTHFVSYNIEKAETEFIEAITSAIKTGEIIRTQITPDNLKTVFDRWVEAIGKEIAGASAEDYVLFFYADVMSDGTVSTHEHMPAELLHKGSRPVFSLNGVLYELGCIEGYRKFWAIYDRPPRQEYQGYLLERRDSLIPLDERSFKGAYYTPLKVVEKAYELLTRTLGSGWQKEYIVWDPCCGVGNLETKHANVRNVYMSTLDAEDIDIMKATKTCVAAERFQYDYLNDDIAEDGSIDYSLSEKLPLSLRKAIEASRSVNDLDEATYSESGEKASNEAKGAARSDDVNEATAEMYGKVAGKMLVRATEKSDLIQGKKNEQISKTSVCNTEGSAHSPHARSTSRKILILMNPPYAEAGNGMNKGDKENVAKTRVAQYCMQGYGKASNELFTQFLARIAQEIPNATIATFSTLKYINAPNFDQFRKAWNAKYLGGFVVHSKAFDGLKGDFPIGFLIWQTHNGKGAARTPITEVSCEVLDKTVEPVGEKTFYNIAKDKYLNVWIKRPRRNDEDAVPLSNAITVSTVKHPVTKWADGAIAYLYCNTNDIQHARQNTVLYSSTYGDGHGFYVTEENLWQAAVVFTVRRIVKHTWLNHNDQFLQPTASLPEEFIDDCLIWMLFNGKNLTASATRLEWQGKDWTLVNHFIPYTEEEVASSSRFESNFLHSYMQGKTYSNEALVVLEAGKHIWRSYFATSFPHSIRSSLHLDRSDVGWYQIRQAFKSLSQSGDSDTASRFTMLDDAFKGAYASLAEKLEIQVYELGFLK